MDLPANRGRWRRRSARSNVPLLVAVLLLLLPASLLLSSAYSSLLRSLLPFSASPSPSSRGGGVQRCGRSAELDGEKFLWYAPHSGFSNQVGELRNAAVAAALLNRTLVVPPVLDHHAVVLGSCPKFRVSDPADLRTAVWDHAMQLLRERRYVSMGDIVDLSHVKALVRTIDFRVFVSLWCGVDMRKTCFSGLCCAVSGGESSPSDYGRCRSLLSGLEGSESSGCVYPVQDDCRTTVWTYQENNDGTLDSFQPDEELRRKKKISYVRKRKDLYKGLGPGSKAEDATLLAFGTLFSGPYKGSESYFDIHESPKGHRIQTVLEKTEFLPFAPEIMAAGKEFAKSTIKEPFLCAQLRLLDGQFKNHWKTTFSALKDKLKALEMEMKRNKSGGPIHMFIMTDLPPANWTKTYLADIAKDEKYELYTLKENDVLQTAEKLMAAEHGLRSGFFPKIAERSNEDCHPVQLPEILLYVEESVCSCASLGFVGTAGSTIAGSIETMRMNNVCKL
ncbi:O-fucosyltransferase 30 [Lolium perenne]|uniref:O-fucosyltransferase 30 n=1 Tax=Lolium perenne TaxID=4522 RepID=UPI0021F648C1|nr:O-fucosyltransferase 30 [Lolium perenne]